jgi:hypothetical protein
MMLNNLIISLGDLNEIYSHLNLIENLKKKDPTHSFYLCTWSEFKEIINSAKIDSLHVTYIDKQLIKRSYNNHLISISYPYNYLFETYKSIARESYKQTYVLTNNQTSFLLASIVKSEHVIGPRFTEHKTIQFQSLQAHFINEIYPSRPCILQKSQLMSDMTGLKKARYFPSLFSNKNTELFELLDTNLSFLRTKFSKKLMAIELTNLKTPNNLAEVYYYLYQSSDFLPILLINAESSAQVEVLKEIQSVMDDKCISLEYTYPHFGQIFHFIDGVVNFGGPSKILCNIFNKPQISILSNLQNIGQSGASDKIGDFIIEANHNALDHELINDLLSIQHVGPINHPLQIPKQTKVWGIIEDAFGPISFMINKNQSDLIADEANFSNLLLRSFYFEYYLKQERHLEMFELFPAEALIGFIEKEVESAESMYRVALKMIRQFHEAKYENGAKREQFFIELDQLMNPSNIDSLGKFISICTRFSLDQSLIEIQDTMPKIEKVLLEYKNALLHGSGIIKSIFDQFAKKHSTLQIGTDLDRSL